MKRKRLLFLATAMVMASSLWAQDVMIETDLTSQFNSLATTQWTGSSGQVTWAAPKVTTNSGLYVAAWERYNGSCDWTGDIMYTTVKGLPKGTYKIELYGAAAFTFGRGFGSEAFTGDFSVDKNSQLVEEKSSITDNTGVTLYAETNAGTVSLEIPIWYATNFNGSGLSTAVLNGVEVGTDGQIKIGLSKTSRSTNWHVVQLKGVTATVNARELLEKAVTDANAITGIPTAAKNALDAVVAQNNQTWSSADEYTAAIEAIEAATAAAQPFVEPYSAWLSAKSTAETEYSDIAFITNIISELSADVEAATNVEIITNAATELNNAITAYSAYAAEKVIAEKIGVEVTEEPTTAAEAAAAVNDLKVAEYNFVNEQYPYDYAPVIGDFGTWTGTATVAGQPATPNYLDYEHWSGETHAYYEQASNGWGNPNGWTIQYEKKAKLPAGDYMLKVAARSSAGTTSSVSCSATDFTVSLPTAGNTAKGIDKSGAANFGEGDFVHDGAGFGWEWRFLPFTLTEETEVTMIFYAKATSQYQWMSISDGTLLSKQEIVNPISIASTDDAAPEATVASEVTTDRKLFSGLNTIVLPFETTATEIGATTVLEYTGTTTSDAGNIVFNFKEVAPVDNVVTLQANVPYAVFVDADQTEALSFGKKNIAPAEDLTTEDSNGQFDFVGTYTNLAKGNSVIVAGDYIAGETAFKKVANGGNRVAAYRAYLKKVGSSEVVSEVAFNFGDTFVDGIEAVEILNKLSGNIYNLNGQKLNNVQKGINIVNGKKLLVK